MQKLKGEDNDYIPYIFKKQITGYLKTSIEEKYGRRKQLVEGETKVLWFDSIHNQTITHVDEQRQTRAFQNPLNTNHHNRKTSARRTYKHQLQWAWKWN
jgi:hypothetical protein